MNSWVTWREPTWLLRVGTKGELTFPPLLK